MDSFVRRNLRFVEISKTFSRSRLVDFAHFLVDECEVDLVHGHSAHHVQGIEQRNGKLILYGCGDAIGKNDSFNLMMC